MTTWELDASTLSLRRPQNYSLNSGKVRRVEFSASGDYVFAVRQVSSSYNLERLKLLNNTTQLAMNSAVDLNVQRIAGGAMLFHAAGNSLQKLEDPETPGTTFATSVVNQTLNFKAGEFPQPTFPVDGSMQALVERVKTEDRNWIVSTSGSASASGMNTLYFPPTGNPVVGNPVAGNYGASRCISIGENLHDSLNFRHVGRVGWTNANFVYRPDNSLMANSLDVKGVADLPSITVELPGGERGYYLITCADGKVLWHQVALTGGELGVVRKNQSLKLETGGFLEYDPLYPQVAMAAYNDQTLAGGTILFVATKRYGAVSLYSFRLYADRIAAGKLVKQFGTPILPYNPNTPIPVQTNSQLRVGRPEQLNPALRLSEMQISPNGRELSLSMTEPETTGLPSGHDC